MVGDVNTSSLRWGSEDMRTNYVGTAARRREIEGYLEDAERRGVKVEVLNQGEATYVSGGNRTAPDVAIMWEAKEWKEGGGWRGGRGIRGGR